MIVFEYLASGLSPLKYDSLVNDNEDYDFEAVTWYTTKA